MHFCPAALRQVRTSRVIAITRSPRQTRMCSTFYCFTPALYGSNFPIIRPLSGHSSLLGSHFARSLSLFSAIRSCLNASERRPSRVRINFKFRVLLATDDLVFHRDGDKGGRSRRVGISKPGGGGEKEQRGMPMKTQQDFELEISTERSRWSQVSSVTQRSRCSLLVLPIFSPESLLG